MRSGNLLRAPGQLGLGRAYVSGELEVNDMDAVLELLHGYAVPSLGAREKARLAASAVRAGALRSVPRAPAAELRPRGRRHSRERDRRAVTHHYDVSTPFQAAGHRARSRTSSALWPRIVLMEIGRLDRCHDRVHVIEQPRVQALG